MARWMPALEILLDRLDDADFAGKRDIENVGAAPGPQAHQVSLPDFDAGYAQAFEFRSG